MLPSRPPAKLYTSSPCVKGVVNETWVGVVGVGRWGGGVEEEKKVVGVGRWGGGGGRRKEKLVD